MRRNAGFYGEHVHKVLGRLLSCAAGFVFFAVRGSAYGVVGILASAWADATREGVFAHPSSFAYFAAGHGLTGDAEGRVSAGRILHVFAGAGKRIFPPHLLVQITSLYHILPCGCAQLCHLSARNRFKGAYI